MYSEFYQDKTGQIILITQYIHDERDNLIKMYENFDMEKRCCGLPPIGRKAIEAWINDVSKRGYGFIAKIGENVVGHIVAVPKGSEAEFAIFVHQDYEDRGIGGELIRFAERFLRNVGVRRLKAMTERTNKVAVEIYRHLGFEIVDRDPFYVFFQKNI